MTKAKVESSAIGLSQCTLQEKRLTTPLNSGDVTKSVIGITAKSVKWDIVARGAPPLRAKLGTPFFHFGDAGRYTSSLLVSRWRIDSDRFRKDLQSFAKVCKKFRKFFLGATWDTYGTTEVGAGEYEFYAQGAITLNINIFGSTAIWKWSNFREGVG